MQPTSALDDALALMRDLRVRCEWDAAQTHESLRPYLLEEAYEVDEAIRSGDDALLREELGDLLLQVLFHSVLASERGAFDADDVARTLVTKMRGRHPHLYGDGVKEPWERMKAKRRRSIVDGLPVRLPALHRAQRLQERAAGVHFDWPDVAGPLAKVAEELTEVTDLLGAPPPDVTPSGVATPTANAESDARHTRLTEELGDLLFSCVNLCRKAGVHAAIALDRANAKFSHRFEAVEALAKARGIPLGQVPLDVLDRLWDDVKAGERPTDGATR